MSIIKIFIRVYSMVEDTRHFSLGSLVAISLVEDSSVLI